MPGLYSTHLRKRILKICQSCKNSSSKDNPSRRFEKRLNRLLLEKCNFFFNNRNNIIEDFEAKKLTDMKLEYNIWVKKH